MKPVVLFDNGVHKNLILPPQSVEGLAIDTVQHLIIHGNSALLLDPGGHGIFSPLVNGVLSSLGEGVSLTHILFTHQDPDIVASANGWLMSFDVKAYLPDVWLWFVAHFGLDRFAEQQMRTIPKEGGILKVDDCEFLVLPAHFLHSCGNYSLYDPISKILYTGDIAASEGDPLASVRDFEAHVSRMVGLHRRYMASRRAFKLWSDLVRKLEVEILAPQHGSYFRGKEMVEAFLNWAENFECGLDLLEKGL